MGNLEVLTYGFALSSDQGAFGYSTNSLLTVGGNKILIDTGPSSRRNILYRALAERNLGTEDIDIVILTHLHSGINLSFGNDPNGDELVSRY